MNPRKELFSIVRLLAWVSVLACLFALTEIQIEGPAGWAASLPTWRIEKHWLLDIFWSGRVMTGYHACIFSFMALMFHYPFFLFGRWSWRLEARTLASLMLFWVIEDFLWFVLNPAWGLDRFSQGSVPWHHHWLAGAPTDYWVSLVFAIMLFALSLRPCKRADKGDSTAL